VGSAIGSRVERSAVPGTAVAVRPSEVRRSAAGEFVGGRLCLLPGSGASWTPQRASLAFSPQLYQFDERVPDDKRTAMTIGRGARFLVGGVDLGAAVISNLFAPLSPALDRFIAMRISLIAHLD